MAKTSKITADPEHVATIQRLLEKYPEFTWYNSGRRERGDAAFLLGAAFKITPMTAETRELYSIRALPQVLAHRLRCWLAEEVGTRLLEENGSFDLAACRADYASLEVIVYGKVRSPILGQ